MENFKTFYSFTYFILRTYLFCTKPFYFSQMIHLLIGQSDCNFTHSGQNMHLWILALFCTAVHSISRISKPRIKAVNFARATDGRKLSGSVIKEIEVDSEGLCRLQCVEEERCQSYNFKTKQNEAGRFKCELNDSDRFFGHIYFTEDENFIYRGIKVNDCIFVMVKF